MKDTNYQTPIYLTARDVAARRHCSVGHLANERSRKRGLPYYKLGGACLYKLNEIESWENARRVETASE